MNDEAQLLLLIWESVQEYIPQRDKKDVATAIIKHMCEYGNDLSVLRDAEGEDHILDQALEEFSEDEHDDYADYDYEDEI